MSQGPPQLTLVDEHFEPSGDAEEKPRQNRFWMPRLVGGEEEEAVTPEYRDPVVSFRQEVERVISESNMRPLRNLIGLADLELQRNYVMRVNSPEDLVTRISEVLLLSWEEDIVVITAPKSRGHVWEELIVLMRFLSSHGVKIFFFGENEIQEQLRIGFSSTPYANSFFSFVTPEPIEHITISHLPVRKNRGATAFCVEGEEAMGDGRSIFRSELMTLDVGERRRMSDYLNWLTSFSFSVDDQLSRGGERALDQLQSRVEEYL